MGKSVRERLQAATGLVFVLLSLISLFALPPRPAAGASAKVIASYYTLHSGAVQAADYIFLLGLLFALWFIGYLRTVFARAEGETQHLSTLFFGSGVVTVVISLAVWGMGLALPGQTANLGVIKALFDVVNVGVTLTFFGHFLLLGASSVLVLRTGVLPRWVGGVRPGGGRGAIAGESQPASPLRLFRSGGTVRPLGLFRIAARRPGGEHRADRAGRLWTQGGWDQSCDRLNATFPRHLTIRPSRCGAACSWACLSRQG